MPRPLSSIAPGWWDYTTLDPQLLAEAAALTAKDLLQLARPGFAVRIYGTLEEFYCAEALEYIAAWRTSTPSRPAGICGPIGPTEQLPLVAAMVNGLDLDLRRSGARFWGMDEWVVDGRPVGPDHPLGFARADRELCFDRIRPGLRPPDEALHFPAGDLSAYRRSWDEARCVLMQGGQGETKHWAFNDPVPRRGRWADLPPTREEYRALGTRQVELHPATILQNARTSGNGYVPLVPTAACTVGPLETWKAERVSIWHPGHHDNPFGIRLSALMVAKRIVDTAVPMSLLADHPDVIFSYYAGGIGSVRVEMH